ncbi:KH domain-containing protein [Candidatus Microgenomates bacterium]|nr:KH domain-containing protein [Candidatus Microgenomates bacterium]
MKDFLAYLVSQIVDKPEMVAVNEQTVGVGIVNLEIVVNPTDMGKVIGKSGRIIRALRDLVKVLAVKHNVRVNVVLPEQ